MVDGAPQSYKDGGKDSLVYEMEWQVFQSEIAGSRQLQIAGAVIILKREFLVLNWLILKNMYSEN